MGTAIAALDRRLNRDVDPPELRQRNGAIAMGVLLGSCGLACWIVTFAIFVMLPGLFAVLLIATLASTCLAQRSLDTHVRDVATALDDGWLDGARSAVARIVGRDVATLDRAGVARAAIESLAENFADGVVAPAFWIAALGLPGAILYKAINTADSMIGHRTARHEAFGFAAAKLDDAANWPAARLAALALAAAAAITPDATAPAAWHIMRRDSGAHPSPNAGWPEAAMAGALGITLGGPRAYDGQTIEHPTMGDGDGRVGARTIHRALRLYRAACGIQLVVVVVLAIVIALI